MGHPKLKSLDFRQVAGSLLVLTGLGHLQPAQTVDARMRERCRALNRFLCQRAVSSGDIGYLAAPAIGGGMSLTREEQLLVLAMMEGKETPMEQAVYLSEIFQSTGEKLNMNGAPLAPGPEMISQLKMLADRFWNNARNVLKAAQVI